MGKLNIITKGIIGLLTLEFILGMVMNLYAVSPDDPGYLTESPLIKYSSITHMVSGIALPLLALILLVLAFKSKKQNLKVWAIYGFISMLMATAGGIGAVMLKDSASELSSFVMSLGFIASFLTYGKFYFLLKNK